MDEQFKKVKKLAINYLARRNYHSDMLCKKLVEQGIEEPTARRAIEELSCYVDDEAYLTRLIQLELSKGHGPRAIAWKLSLKGLSKQAIQSALTSSASFEAEKSAILQLLSKNRQRNRQEAMGWLLRRGFSSNAITSALQEFPTPR